MSETGQQAEIRGPGMLEFGGSDVRRGHMRERLKSQGHIGKQPTEPVRAQRPPGRLTLAIGTEAPGCFCASCALAGKLPGHSLSGWEPGAGRGLQSPLVKAGQGCVYLKGKGRWPGSVLTPPRGRLRSGNTGRTSTLLSLCFRDSRPWL